MEETTTWEDKGVTFSVEPEEGKWRAKINGNVIKTYNTKQFAERFLRREPKTVEGYLDELEFITQDIMTLKAEKHFGAQEVVDSIQGVLRNYFSRKSLDTEFQNALNKIKN